MRRCTLCHVGSYRDELVVFSARRGNRLIVVEDVPALVCDMCGDQIFADETAREIERAATGEPAYSAPIYRFPRKAV